MKKLILLLNDYPGTGKSTLAHCFGHYLRRFGADYQYKVLLDDEEAEDSERHLAAGQLTPRSFLEVLDESPITILELSTGQAEFFAKFYSNFGLDLVLDEAGISLSAVIPVTSESESFDAVIEAAETYSDHAEYLIAHLITSSYEDDDKVWDRSYAARVMDMFEAVELHIPEAGPSIEEELQNRHMDLTQLMDDKELQQGLGGEFTKWHNRVLSQVDSAKQYLFGDAFRPTLLPKLEEKKRRAKARVA